MNAARARLPRLVAFDLDGTLVDSRHDIATAANLTLTQLGLPAVSDDAVIGFIGGGVRNLALRTLAASLGPEASPPTPEEFIAAFMPIYGEHLLDRTIPYPGTVETLEALTASGVVCAVVTNKPAEPARRIIEGLQLGPFALVVGGDSTPTRKPDPEPLLRVLRHVGAAPGESLYVGDMAIDAQTASAARVPFVAVTWGLGSRASLEAAGARTFAEEMADVARIAGAAR